MSENVIASQYRIGRLTVAGTDPENSDSYPLTNAIHVYVDQTFDKEVIMT